MDLDKTAKGIDPAWFTTPAGALTGTILVNALAKKPNWKKYVAGATIGGGLGYGASRLPSVMEAWKKDQTTEPPPAALEAPSASNTLAMQLREAKSTSDPKAVAETSDTYAKLYDAYTKNQAEIPERYTGMLSRSPVASVARIIAAPATGLEQASMKAPALPSIGKFTAELAAAKRKNPGLSTSEFMRDFVKSTRVRAALAPSGITYFSDLGGTTGDRSGLLKALGKIDEGRKEDRLVSDYSDLRKRYASMLANQLTGEKAVFSRGPSPEGAGAFRKYITAAGKRGMTPEQAVTMYKKSPRMAWYDFLLKNRAADKSGWKTRSNVSQIKDLYERLSGQPQ